MSEPTKVRPGDQVLPTGDTSIPDDQSLVIADIERRRQVGIERYGQGHRPFNGRNTLLDGYEEILDLLVYWRSLLRAREANRERLIEVVTVALRRLPDIAISDSQNRDRTAEAAAFVVDRILDAVSDPQMHPG